MKLRLTSALAACLTLSACNDPPLNPLVAVFAPANATKSVQVDFCTDPAANQKIVQKLLIILDHSGSNAKNYLMSPDGSGAPALVNGTIVIDPKYATDPTGHTRYGDVKTPGTLLNYLSTLPPNDPANPSLYFGLIDFNGQANSYPASGTPFTSDISAFFQHVQGEIPPNDTGNTDYLAALTTAYTMINGDIQNAKKCAALALGSVSPGAWCLSPGVSVASYYTLVFMSDGSPITSIGGVGTDANGNIVVTGPITITKQPTDQILGEVSTIMGLSADTKDVAGMNLFSIYYYVPGNIDLSSQSLLASMAKAGNGIAYNALSGSNIDYQAFLPSTKHIKYTLTDVFVTNSSVVVGSDGVARLDSDRDGLPDELEVQLGTDPHKADTYGLGISDLVLYELRGKLPCLAKNALGICTDALPATATNLTTGTCKGLSAGGTNPPTFPTSDPGGLNDCEKLVLNDAGGIGKPDSNGDLISDILEFKNGVAFQPGSTTSVTSPGLDGLSIYQKIKTSLPANTPLYQLLTPSPANYDLNLTSTSDIQDCYNLVVANLPIVGDSNTIRVDIILQNVLAGNQTLFRVGTKTFAPGAANLQFNDWNDAGEKNLGTWKQWP